ncbi:MAG TPA: malate synthase A, partial [Gammaproteobacteria bacterium]|nr:malate synthase A [Gammaproteobacteria bacterium]
MPESKQVSNENTDTRLQLTLPPPTGTHEVISPDALDFVVALHDKFASRVSALLDDRKIRQREINAGKLPDFLPHDPKIHEDDWQVASIPADLQDRRVEITGPTDRKMVINALNSGARVFMADFEDSLTPTWNNLLEGQLNLRDANRQAIDFTSDAGKDYTLNTDHAVLIVRPRGWHLPEKHALVDDKPIPGALFDFGLYLFHNAEQLHKNGSGPYFYLPKLENHHEAALWNDVFAFAE